MTAKARNILLISIGALILASLLVMVCSRTKSERREPEALQKSASDDSIASEFIKVKLFYFSESSSYLQPVPREIKVPEIREEIYKKFAELLLAGSRGLITPAPAGIQVRSVFFIEELAMLVLDFNEALTNSFPGGTAAELEFIYFIVDNFCYNFKEIKKVKILSGGNENRTLAGHIDLEKPFYPNYNWLKNE